MLNKSKNTDTENFQLGSVSLFVIAIVVMAMSLSLGILAVAESMIARKQAAYGTQASANAGAFVYGRTYVKELNACIKEKILESSSAETTSDDSLESTEPTLCDQIELRACAESDFKECELDLPSCWSDEESPIMMCQQDERVKERARAAAQDGAQGIANEYGLTQFQFSIENETSQVSAIKQHETQIPTFGKSASYATHASSRVIISENGNEE